MQKTQNKYMIHGTRADAVHAAIVCCGSIRAFALRINVSERLVSDVFATWSNDGSAVHLVPRGAKSRKIVETANRYIRRVQKNEVAA